MDFGWDFTVLEFIFDFHFSYNNLLSYFSVLTLGGRIDTVTFNPIMSGLFELYEVWGHFDLPFINLDKKAEKWIFWRET